MIKFQKMGNNSLINCFKKLCESLGRSNKATYAVVAIAVTKGIFRPIFTLLDKHENPKTKKYTALREGLTEVVAIPTYIGIAKGAEMIATNLKISGKENVEIAKHNANFIGVCFAAAIVIPVVTSIIINPMIKLFMKDVNQHKIDLPRKPHFLDLKRDVAAQNPIKSKDFDINIKAPYTYKQSYANLFVLANQFGLKVGGL